MEISGGETGWDVFKLEYHLDGPLSTILPPSSMLMYNQIFVFLWRLKRVGHTLSTMWRTQTTITTSSDIHHRCSLLVNGMFHFVHVLEHYMFFEVIECGWESLIGFVKSEFCDLDTLVQKHHEFLVTVLRKCLLTDTYNVLFHSL